MKKFITLVSILFLSISTVLADDMRFVQVTDTLFSKSNPASVEMLKNLVKKINSTKDVDFVVFTGNNIAKPKLDYLEDFLSILKGLKTPYYIVIGNKDVNKTKDLSKKEYIKIVRKKNKYQKFVYETNYAFTKNGIAFIVVDGAKEVIPTPSGYYKPETLTWLDNQLKKYDNKKVVILQHFPIIPPTQDELKYTYKPEEYLSVLEENSNVEAIFAGHFGVNSEKDVNGVLHVTTAPAPQYRVVDIMDYDTDNPIFWSTIKH